MRSLFFDFADDPEAGKVTDGYMFGRSLLVYPVTEQMYYDRNSRPVDSEHKRTCYLLAGCGWYDFWTEEYYEGGQYVTVDAPIDRIPLFVREGSILPMIEQIMYADAADGMKLKLNVYTGKDAVFRYYEDSGDGYGYENGEYAVTQFSYDEGTGTLSRAERLGSYPGMKPLHYDVEMIKKQERSNGK